MTGNPEVNPANCLAPFHGNLDRILKSEVSTSDEIGAFITTIPVWRHKFVEFIGENSQF